VSARNPVSPKVVASAAGAGAGATLSTFLIWLIGALLINAWTADAADNAIAAVPWPVSGIVLLVVTVVFSAVPGYVTTDPARQADTNPQVAAYEDQDQGEFVSGQAAPMPVGESVEVVPVEEDRPGGRIVP
jgi:hypothetical protein